MDQFIKAMYGDPPPTKRANLSIAIDLAVELLMGQVPEKEISILGTKLDSGPIPYSTHDLALSIALNFFKDPQYLPTLGAAQLMARMTMLEWFQDNKVAPLLVRSFEDTLYKLYK
ncbi:MAG: hypothetical protein ACKVOY_07560 [Burkholderiaceae bacterium]